MNLGIREASDIYGKRMHNLCCDNCHSHVATALGRIIACLSKRTKKKKFKQFLKYYLLQSPEEVIIKSYFNPAKLRFTLNFMKRRKNGYNNTGVLVV